MQTLALQTPKSRMDLIVRSFVDRTIETLLPGAEDLVASDTRMSDWICRQWGRVRQALAAGDEVFLENALGTWVKAWTRVLEILAEDYRKTHLVPEEWELRYFKWMNKVHLRCTGKIGTFLIYPHRPRNPPRGVAWYTAADMLEIVSGPPSIAAAIKLFGILPVRAEDLPQKPRRGEQFLIIDATGDDLDVKGFRG